MFLHRHFNDIVPILHCAAVVLAIWLATTLLSRNQAARAYFKDNCGSRLWMIILVASASAMWQFWPMLKHGFFKYDDFEMLALAQEPITLRNIFLPHYDHILPGLRLQAAMAVRVVGLNAELWNAILMLHVVACLTSWGLLVSKATSSPAAGCSFVVGSSFWPQWPELCHGYYCQIGVLQAGIALALLLLTSHHLTKGSPSGLSQLAIFLSLVVASNGIASFWLVWALLITRLADPIDQARKAWRMIKSLWRTVLTVAVLGAGCIWMLLHLSDQTEVIARFLSYWFRSNLATLPFQIARCLFLGVLPHTILPFGFLLAPHPLSSLLIRTLVSACLVWVVFRCWPKTDYHVKRVGIEATACVAPLLAMVCLARPEQLDLTLAKHLLSVHLASTAMIFALLGTTHTPLTRFVLLSVRNVARPTLLLALFAGAGQWARSACLWRGVQNPVISIDAAWQQMDRTRADLNRLAREISQPAHSNRTLPNIPGSVIHARFPDLYPLPLNVYARFIAINGGQMRTVSPGTFDHTSALEGYAWPYLEGPALPNQNEWENFRASSATLSQLYPQRTVPQNLVP